MQVRKRTYDPLFTYREGEEEDYFNVEGLEAQLHEFWSSSKGKVPLQGNEGADVETLKTSKGEEAISGSVTNVAHVVSTEATIATEAAPTEVAP